MNTVINYTVKIQWRTLISFCSLEEVKPKKGENFHYFFTKKRSDIMIVLKIFSILKKKFLLKVNLIDTDRETIKSQK